MVDLGDQPRARARLHRALHGRGALQVGGGDARELLRDEQIEVSPRDPNAMDELLLLEVGLRPTGARVGELDARVDAAEREELPIDGEQIVRAERHVVALIRRRRARRRDPGEADGHLRTEGAVDRPEALLRGRRDVGQVRVARARRARLRGVDLVPFGREALVARERSRDRFVERDARRLGPGGARERQERARDEQRDAPVPCRLTRRRGHGEGVRARASREGGVSATASAPSRMQMELPSSPLVHRISSPAKLRAISAAGELRGGTKMVSGSSSMRYITAAVGTSAMWQRRAPMSRAPTSPAPARCPSTRSRSDAVTSRGSDESSPTAEDVTAPPRGKESWR